EGREVLTFEEHTGPVWGVAFRPDGTHLASASADHTVRVRAAKGGKGVKPLDLGCAVNQVAFSPDGRRLAAACDDGSVRVWDVDPFQQVFFLKGHGASVGNVAFSPDRVHL